MPSGIEQILLAARHYCVANSSRLMEETDRAKVGSKCAIDKRGIAYRMLVLSAILDEIEAFVPSDFTSKEEAQQYIIEAIMTAHSIETEGPLPDVYEQCIRAERDNFRSYMLELTAEQMSQVEMLPYRRVLAKREIDHLKKRMNSIWKIDYDYGFYPLSEYKPRNTEAFQEEYFHQEVGANVIRDLLEDRGIHHVWELREFGSSYDMDSYWLSNKYPPETYWTSEAMDWLIYASHEDSITISGWLLKKVIRYWKNWRKRIYPGSLFQ